MFEGKHCTYADYQRLVGESESFLRELGASGELDVEKHRKTDRFLSFIASYDEYVAADMRRKIAALEGDVGRIRRIIIRGVEELKQNVLVDIQEHRLG